jgi:tRNA dimethylallyltransferase
MASISPLPKLIAIVGPTASGKTALALALAKKFDGEIVSADSRQVYRGMNIGTAKPTKAERCAVPHHLVDIKDPDEEYSVAEYKRDAMAAIREIAERGRLPILIGGTGLYIKTIVENLDIPKVVANDALRAKIENEIKTEGLAAVFKKLVALDPEAAYIVDPKNPRRVVRALEVALTTGRPFTAQRTKNEPLFDVLMIGIDPPPHTLRKRIDVRIDRMMRAGLVKEVRGLVKRYGAECKAFDAIGYREIIAALHGSGTVAEAAARMETNTWRYAKRQITWFKKDGAVAWNLPRAKLFLKIKKWRGIA